ncbi:hypothetical protein BD414DRAFT_566746, partial [Trametes punicea]
SHDFLPRDNHVGTSVLPHSTSVIDPVQPSVSSALPRSPPVTHVDSSSSSTSPATDPTAKGDAPPSSSTITSVIAIPPSNADNSMSPSTTETAYDPTSTPAVSLPGSTIRPSSDAASSSTVTSLHVQPLSGVSGTGSSGSGSATSDVPAPPDASSGVGSSASKSHSHSTVVMVLSAVLGLLGLAVVAGLVLLCKRRRARHPSSATPLLKHDNSKDVADVQQRDEGDSMGGRRDAFPVAAMFQPNSGHVEERNCTSPTSSLLVIPSADSSVGAYGTRADLGSFDNVGQFVARQDEDPQTALSHPLRTNARGREVRSGDDREADESPWPRSEDLLPPSLAAVSETTGLDQATPMHGTLAIIPTSTPIDFGDLSEKDAAPNSSPAERQETQLPQDHCPRSDALPSPSLPSTTPTRDVDMLLPLRFSGATPPHPRFVAVLMDLQQDGDQEEPPPYHPRL